MLIWDMVRFHIICSKADQAMFQINISTFGAWMGLVSHIRNPTMIQIYRHSNLGTMLLSISYCVNVGKNIKFTSSLLFQSSFSCNG